MTKRILFTLLILSLHGVAQTITLTKSDLQDKIKGAWAGQVIGCTYGGPTEFRWNSTIIKDYVPLEWDASKIEWWYDNAPGLYDDVYMDLTFVQVFEEKGLEAPAEEFAEAFAYAEYPLWHANNMARWNIKQGIMPPESGHWLNNPHADDIDYQIEADFSGIMAPGMPNTSAEISDKIGHIMNYGDGWYGGVYVGAMYSLAFIHDDINTVVQNALQVIPDESNYYKCMADVIAWHQQYPNDWKQTWLEVQKKYGQDIGCPNGVFVPFNIDAVVNSAWILVGLLYGEGDFGKTIELSTRAGDDSDCNPASAGGILGCILGYDNIPDFWKQGLDRVEDRDFKFTTISLNDSYDMSFRHALAVIEQNGGTVGENEVTIQVQEPMPVKLEKGFEDHFPVERRRIRQSFKKDFEFEFQGVGFAATGSVNSKGDAKTVLVEQYIDDVLVETIELSTEWIDRRETLAWSYNLPADTYSVRFVVQNPSDYVEIEINDVIIYSDKNE